MLGLCRSTESEVCYQFSLLIMGKDSYVWCSSSNYFLIQLLFADFPWNGGIESTGMAFRRTKSLSLPATMNKYWQISNFLIFRSVQLGLPAVTGGEQLPKHQHSEYYGGLTFGLIGATFQRGLLDWFQWDILYLQILQKADTTAGFLNVSFRFLLVKDKTMWSYSGKEDLDALWHNMPVFQSITLLRTESGLG